MKTILIILFSTMLFASDSTKVKLEIKEVEKQYQLIENKIAELRDAQKELTGIWKYLKIKEAEADSTK